MFSCYYCINRQLIDYYFVIKTLFFRLIWNRDFFYRHFFRGNFYYRDIFSRWFYSMYLLVSTENRNSSVNFLSYVTCLTKRITIIEIISPISWSINTHVSFVALPLFRIKFANKFATLILVPSNKGHLLFSPAPPPPNTGLLVRRFWSRAEFTKIRSYNKKKNKKTSISELKPNNSIIVPRLSGLRRITGSGAERVDWFMRT